MAEESPLNAERCSALSIPPTVTGRSVHCTATRDCSTLRNGATGNARRHRSHRKSRTPHVPANVKNPHTTRVSGPTPAHTARCVVSWKHMINEPPRRSRAPGASRAEPSGCNRETSDKRGHGGGLTPELAEVIKRTFRGMHFLAWLRHEELAAEGRESDLEAAVESARSALVEMLDETVAKHLTLRFPFDDTASPAPDQPLDQAGARAILVPPGRSPPPPRRGFRAQIGQGAG